MAGITHSPQAAASVVAGLAKVLARMAISRRNFLAGAALAGLAPRLVHAETTADGFEAVRARRGLAQLLENPAPATPVWSFTGSAAPAVIRARQGESLKLRLFNELDFEIWLHFFGVRGPSELMTINVPAGTARGVDCVFTPPDAGTFWIGPMADVSRLRDMGLYALLVVGEAATLPDIDDLPLIIDDWKLGDNGAMEGHFGDIETMVGEGRLGNWFTVNGVHRPRLTLPAAKLTRLRLLNAANVRRMNLLFKGGDIALIGLDGQPVPLAPLGSEPLALAPGQRADLLVSPGSDVSLALDFFGDVAGLADLIRGGTGDAPALPDTSPLPANPTATPADPATARRVPLAIEGGLKGGLKSALYRGQPMELRGLLEHGLGWAFNGAAGPGGPPLVEAKRGETLIIAVDNRTGFEQPIHLHGHIWREAGSPGSPWRDTAVIAAHRTMDLLMVADNPGSWAVQSLIAERADGGLLTGFTVA
ncbi:MAG: multicopper oxidase family protein [Rhizobiales bacterium]|nr:multicopper oxidase family protein [Hyphomicrobiales bacterium]MBI3674109.1 multicopper oxidase family protein [Hyphomicrobiales bacterium]